MEKKKAFVEQFLNEQIKNFDNKRKEIDESGEQFFPVITISTSPGSLGSKIAQNLTQLLGFDLYNREIIKAVAKSANIDSSLIDTMEKHRFSGVEDFIASLVSKDYVWPGLYMEHLEMVVKAISRRGHSVIVGRGANFMLPAEYRFSVRTVSDFDKRKDNVMQAFNVSARQAEERIRNRESRRKEYIRKSFNADINDPVHYDLVLNTGGLDLETCTEAVKYCYLKKFSITKLISANNRDVK
jgi:cytidylate kinase